MNRIELMKQPNSFGEYTHLIRVNGRRSVIGCGHTANEAYRNALDAAQEVWRDNAHIFDFLRPIPAHRLVSGNK